MRNLTKPLLLVAGFVAFAALPAHGAGTGVHKSIDSSASDVDYNTAPMTSDYDTTTEDALILDEPLSDDPIAEETMAAPPIAGEVDDFETTASPLPRDSELARNLKLHVSKNSALSPGGQDVQLLQQGDQVILDGTVSTPAEANYINKIVSQFAGDQRVVNQIRLTDESIVGGETMETY